MHPIPSLIRSSENGVIFSVCGTFSLVPRLLVLLSRVVIYLYLLSLCIVYVFFLYLRYLPLCRKTDFCFGARSGAKMPPGPPSHLDPREGFQKKTPTQGRNNTASKPPALSGFFCRVFSGILYIISLNQRLANRTLVQVNPAKALILLAFQRLAYNFSFSGVRPTRNLNHLLAAFCLDLLQANPAECQPLLVLDALLMEH